MIHPSQSPLIKKVVNTLADRFDTAEAIVDRKCATPGRIARKNINCQVEMFAGNTVPLKVSSALAGVGMI